jgi:hypothetical protein
MKQSCNKKEKNRTNIFKKRAKTRKTKKQKNSLTIRIFFKHLKIEKK